MLTRFTSKKFRVRLLSGLAMIVMLETVGASTALAANKQCARIQDVVALNMRVLQTELMVAALSCGEKERYNDFVVQHQSELVRGGKNLRGFFTRVHKGKSQKALNNFVTLLANEASERSLYVGRGKYCADTAALFDQVRAVQQKGLNSFVQDIRFFQHGYEPCDKDMIARLITTTTPAAGKPTDVKTVTAPARKPFHPVPKSKPDIAALKANPPPPPAPETAKVEEKKNGVERFFSDIFGG